MNAKQHRAQRRQTGRILSQAGRMALPRFLLLACACGVWSAPVWPQDIKRGEALFENHCKACHEPHLRFGEHREVKSLSELKKRISSWAAHSGESWDRHDIEDVLHYLNTLYYHFEEKAL